MSKPAPKPQRAYGAYHPNGELWATSPKLERLRRQFFGKAWPQFKAAGWRCLPVVVTVKKARKK